MTAIEGPPGAPPRGRMTIVFLIHEAFRRDFGRLGEAVTAPGVDAARARQLQAHWAFVDEQLHHHHEVEDASLWPILRPKLAGDTHRLGVLDTLEAQHRELLPSCDTVTAGFAALVAEPGAERGQALAADLDDAAAGLGAHLDYEEAEGFPVVEEAMTQEEFTAFGKATAKAVGMKGSAVFFPWIFDGADPVERRAVLSMPPPPVRILCSALWEPRYRKRSAALWGA